MSRADLLRALFEHRAIRVGPPGHDPKGLADADAALVDHEVVIRAEFPGAPPSFSIECGRWALQAFHRACQFLVYRDADAEAIATALAEPCPSRPAASRHYSVDLVFRFLPDLVRLATTTSDHDPLCDHLRQWAVAWPLSSVGVPNVTVGDIADIWDHDGLSRLYVDRVIARGDTARLADPRVRARVKAALGHFHALAPGLAEALQDDTQPVGPSDFHPTA